MCTETCMHILAQTVVQSDVTERDPVDKASGEPTFLSVTLNDDRLESTGSSSVCKLRPAECSRPVLADKQP